MQILFLTQIIPYPPDAGPKVKTWHVLRYLAKSGHRVALASFVRPEEEESVPALKKVCSEVYTIPIRRSRFLDVGYLLRSYITGRPFLIERDDFKAMRHCVRDILASHPIDVIHADQLTMTQFALPELSPPNRNNQTPDSKNGRTSPRLVFDAHNAVWTIMERMAQTVPWYIKPILQTEVRRVKQYEGMIVDTFDHTLAVTDVDSMYLMEAKNEYKNSAHSSDDLRHRLPKSDSVTVVPIAIDAELLRPIQRKPASKNIFTMGTLHYPPNADGIRWFVRDVLPIVKQQIPDVTLTIAGRNPPADFLKFSDEFAGTITVEGYVPDLQPYLEKSALMVVPVRAGSGMRVRILEAFAQAMPVITTTVGLEGIDALPDRDILVADTPQAFADSVIKLLKDEVLQARLAANGRSLAERSYDWKVILNKMEKIYDPHGVNGG